MRQVILTVSVWYNMGEKAVLCRCTKFLQQSADGTLPTAFAVKIFWRNLTGQGTQSQRIIAGCR